MSELYKNYTIVSGVGKGLTSLSAFDNALLNAGVGAYNNRDRKYSDIKLVSSTAKPTDDLYYCTFSGIALW